MWVVCAQLLSLWDPLDCSSSGFSFHGFFRQECWSGSPFSPAKELPDPGDQTQGSCIAGGLLCCYTTGEPPHGLQSLPIDVAVAAGVSDASTQS